MSNEILVALYARISDRERQGNNFSISTQLEKMRDYAQTQGWTVVVELAEKDSAFQEGLERGELNQAIALAGKGTINALLFFSRDRFTRSMNDGIVLRKELWTYGTRLFCFWPSPLEITSEDDIVHVLHDWQAQKQIEAMKAASMRGVEGKVLAGLFPQGNIAWGYQLIGKKHNTRVEVVEDIAYTVIDIYDWYFSHHMGCAEISRKLNEAHTPTPKNKGPWTERGVRHILTNETYSGIWYAYQWKKVRKNYQIKQPKRDEYAITMPVIIPRTRWEQVQEKLRTRRAGRYAEHHYLMSCRLRCTCGRAISAKPTRNQPHRPGLPRPIYFYYRCTSEIAGKGKCGMKYWSVPEVDETVWRFAYELIRDPERLIRGYQEMQRQDADRFDALERQIAALESQITSEQEVLDSLIDQRAATKSLAVRAALDERIETYGAMIDELSGCASTLISQRQSLILTDGKVDEMVAELTALREMYVALEHIDRQADFSAKQALIDMLDLKATLRIDSEGTRWVDIHWASKVHPRELRPQKTQEGHR